MPYTGPDDSSLPSNVKKLSKKKREQWIAVFESAVANGDDEGTAMRKANGAVKAAEAEIRDDSEPEQMRELGRIPDEAKRRFQNGYKTAADGCWEWQGHKTGKGYGQFKLDGVAEKAHRVAYAIAHGGCPNDKQLLHSCNNTSCVNPAHLRLGTNDENVEDRYGKKAGELLDFGEYEGTYVMCFFNIGAGTGEEPMSTYHITLVKIECDESATPTIFNQLYAVARHAMPMIGRFTGYGRFLGDGDDDDTAYLVPSVEGLAEVRQRIVDSLREYGYKCDEVYGWNPHATFKRLRRREKLEPMPMEKSVFNLDSLTLAVNGHQYNLPFQGYQGGGMDFDELVDSLPLPSELELEGATGMHQLYNDTVNRIADTDSATEAIQCANHYRIEAGRRRGLNRELRKIGRSPEPVATAEQLGWTVTPFIVDAPGESWVGVQLTEHGVTLLKERRRFSSDEEWADWYSTPMSLR